ncbi:CBL-interacting serine/threonine-protein kinase 25-like [Silene latifolia]|uniref:CBL-interacting serine/threonine-protein kinase 25-like n=1 Tax=Silene latifolia TaxID=37657 RepID=UPI003D783E3C
MEGKVLFGKYELGKLLGKGNFGKVYKSRHISTGETVAIKTISKDEVKKQGMSEQVKREISVMPLVKHPYIVDLKEVMATKTTIYLVMEYVGGGDLYTKVLHGGKLEENLARKLFQQLITAVEFCHSRGVCHRDLKLENILLDSSGENLKLADFGLATLPGGDRDKSDTLLYTPCGAFAYMAPEIVKGEGYDGKKSDIWSCGVILFALIAGYPPFQDENRMRMMWKIRVGKYEFPSDFPKDIKGLVHKMLMPKPSERITMFEIISTTWFTKGYHHPYGSSQLEGSRCSISSVSFNAFDFIQLMASGLDLSSLFETKKRRLGTTFVTNCSTMSLVNKVEDLAKGLNYNVCKEKGVVRIVLRGEEVGRKGKMVISVRVFDVSPEIKVVEFSRWSGDCVEYVRLMEEEVRPAMEDVVWKWQGDWYNNNGKGSSGGSVTKRCFGLSD